VILHRQSAAWRSLDNPGEVLERVKEQIGSTDDGGELEARHGNLSTRLASRQAEKDRCVRTYAQGHIAEEELEVYLADLKNQTDNLRLLLASVEVERSQKREETELAETPRRPGYWRCRSASRRSRATARRHSGCGVGS
jgi:hypothetical protein